MNSLLVSDAYKQSHIHQYPEGTSLVYSNWTPRSDKYASTKDGVVVFGIQAFLLKIHRHFEINFKHFCLRYIDTLK
jgi:nicotinamide phosphoribosyltransferase